MITKRSKLFSLVLSMGLLLGLAVSGCTDKDREPGPEPTPTPVPETTADVYVDVSALDLAYDALYCAINTADEAFQVEVNEEGLGLIAEDQEVGDTISFSLSFQLEGKEVATYEAHELTVTADEEGQYIIVVNDVAPVSDDDIDVYVDASNVKIGYTKAIAKSGEEEIELEFDEDGISTTPVTTVKEGEKAKFSVSFIQTQSDITELLESDEEQDAEFSDVEIASYDASEEGVEVTGEEGKAVVAIEETQLASPACLTFDMSQVTASNTYHDKTITYAAISVRETPTSEMAASESDSLYKVIAMELRQQGEGFSPISIDGLNVPKNYYIIVGFFPDADDFTTPIAAAEICPYDDPMLLEEESTFLSISDEDIIEWEEH